MYTKDGVPVDSLDILPRGDDTAAIVAEWEGRDPEGRQMSFTDFCDGFRAAMRYARMRIDGFTIPIEASDE